MGKKSLRTPGAKSCWNPRQPQSFHPFLSSMWCNSAFFVRLTPHCKIRSSWGVKKDEIPPCRGLGNKLQPQGSDAACGRSSCTTGHHWTKEAMQGHGSCSKIDRNVNQNSNVSCWTRRFLSTHHPAFHIRFKSITMSSQKNLPHHQKPSTNDSSSLGRSKKMGFNYNFFPRKNCN